MNARELESMMAATFGEGWRGKAIVGPLGVFHLGDVFAECGLEDPRIQLRPTPLPPLLPIFDPSSYSAAPSYSAAEQVAAGVRYIQARYPMHEAARVASLEAYRQTFGQRPAIFDEFERYKRPWWSRAVAWLLAAWYAVRR